MHPKKGCFLPIPQRQGPVPITRQNGVHSGVRRYDVLGWVMSGQEAAASPASRRVTPNHNIQLEVVKEWPKVVCKNAHKGDAGSS